MLNGIPEFDLGINAKLQNIERTETAKRLMATDLKNNIMLIFLASNSQIKINDLLISILYWISGNTGN
jgi:hypothetical protein